MVFRIRRVARDGEGRKRREELEGRVIRAEGGLLTMRLKDGRTETVARRDVLSIEEFPEGAERAPSSARRLAAMDAFVRSTGLEELIGEWERNGVPVGASPERLEAIASDPDLFLACMRIFRRAACDQGAYR